MVIKFYIYFKVNYRLVVSLMTFYLNKLFSVLILLCIESAGEH